MQLSEFLRKTRQDKGQTQLEAAAEVGVHVQTWSNWERGLPTSNVHVLERIADWGQTTVSKLSSMVRGAA